MLLHLLNKSPEHAALQRCTGFIRRGDCLVLLEDGVYCATSNAGAALRELIKRGIPLYAVSADVEARGLSARLGPDIKLINYEELVALSIQYTKSKRWG